MGTTLLLCAATTHTSRRRSCEMLGFLSLVADARKRASAVLGVRGSKARRHHLPGPFRSALLLLRYLRSGLHELQMAKIQRA